MEGHRRYVITPRWSRLKVECRVYDTHRMMMAAIRKDHARGGQSGAANDTYALTCTDPTLIPKGHGAVVYFYTKGITPGRIAHEFDHAAFAILARRRIKHVECSTAGAADHEDDHAYVVQDLVDGFYKKCALIR